MGWFNGEISCKKRMRSWYAGDPALMQAGINACGSDPGRYQKSETFLKEYNQTQNLIYGDSAKTEAKETETAIMEAFQNASPQEIISLVLDQSLQFLTKHKAKWRLVTLFGFKMNDFPYIHDIMIKKYIGYVQLFTGLFTQLNVENPEMEAKLFAATLDGIAMQYLMFNDDEYPLEEKYQGLKNKYKND